MTLEELLQILDGYKGYLAFECKDSLREALSYPIVIVENKIIIINLCERNVSFSHKKN